MAGDAQTTKQVEEAKAKLAHGVNHIRIMQQQVRNMFQFCCILGFGFAFYKFSSGAHGSSVSELFDLVVSAALAVTVNRGGMVTMNWTRAVMCIISVLHLALFVSCIPLAYSGYALSEEIHAFLEFRAQYIRPAINDVICADFGRQLPLSSLLYFLIFFADRYMEKTYRTTLASYTAMVELSERIQGNGTNSKASDPKKVEQKKKK